MNLVDLTLGMGLEKLDFLAEYTCCWIRNGTQLREGIAGTFQKITASIKRKRLANYIYSGLVGFAMMPSLSIDISRADYDSELIQKSSQPPALV
jgi:hypothetical protein